MINMQYKIFYRLPMCKQNDRLPGKSRVKHKEFILNFSYKAYFLSWWYTNSIQYKVKATRKWRRRYRVRACHLVRRFSLLFISPKLSSLDVVLKTVAGQYPEAVYVVVSVETVQFKCCFEYWLHGLSNTGFADGHILKRLFTAEVEQSTYVGRTGLPKFLVLFSSAIPLAITTVESFVPQGRQVWHIKTLREARLNHKLVVKAISHQAFRGLIALSCIDISSPLLIEVYPIHKLNMLVQHLGQLRWQRLLGYFGYPLCLPFAFSTYPIHKLNMLVQHLGQLSWQRLLGYFGYPLCLLFVFSTCVFYSSEKFILSQGQCKRNNRFSGESKVEHRGTNVIGKTTRGMLERKIYNQALLYMHLNDLEVNKHVLCDGLK
uniref:Uncharacterized protein n=1 Tax=Cucumis melo TaxID=3656 RepID=A0A9I9EJN4_CUCME